MSRNWHQNTYIPDDQFNDLLNDESMMWKVHEQRCRDTRKSLEQHYRERVEYFPDSFT